ncbi:MAG TPA: histidine phosphatase family protein [Archangium sp.]|uniref:histidine phosphatase family protein n=1 Tax=Archangium sp. TaxID=1872627 RepID=UPI002ED9BAFB
MSPSVLHWLARLPRERPVAMLLRHAARPPIPPGETGNELALTQEGLTLAKHLGGLLGPRLAALHTSPVLRCLQTAEALREGARVDLDILPDRMLGAPGAFVLDEVLGGQTLQRLGLESFLEHLISGEGVLPGIAEPSSAASSLLRHLLGRSGNVEGLHVFVTHDSLLAPTVARTLQCPVSPVDWPEYLEAAFYWREGADVWGAYRTRASVCLAG